MARNTPTCVGKTASWVTTQRPVKETPPRAWGRPAEELEAAHRVGNTPTCVGKTIPRHAPRRPSRKHPHVRGEDTEIAVRGAVVWETPPRAWGRRIDAKQLVARDGNTPTCVGKTLPPPLESAEKEKHPHVRGEDCSTIARWRYMPETPPRAWGRLVRNGFPAQRSRNTPTCVGKTFSAARLFASGQKHPHVRGEDHLADLHKSRERETPPRAWGRPEHLLRGRHGRRNTPTCVGKTPPRARGRAMN